MTRQSFDQAKHRQILTALLLDIVKAVGHKLAFKGGTMAMLFYHLPRISVNLDFDMRERLTEKDIEILKTAIQKHGDLKDANDKRYTLFFLLDYEQGAKNIKIEFSKRPKNHDSYQRVWLLGVPITILDEQSAFTNKLIALTTRKSTAARDLFDMYYFAKMGFEPKEKLIREQVNMDTQSYLDYVISFVQTRFSEKDILQGVGEFLEEQQRQWARSKLVPETIKELEQLKQRLLKKQ